MRTALALLLAVSPVHAARQVRSPSTPAHPPRGLSGLPSPALRISAPEPRAANGEAAAGPSAADQAAEAAAAVQPQSDPGLPPEQGGGAASAPFDGARADVSDPVDRIAALIEGPRRFTKVEKPAGLQRVTGAAWRLTGLAAMERARRRDDAAQRAERILQDPSKPEARRAVAARVIGVAGGQRLVPLLGWTEERDSSKRVREAARQGLLYSARLYMPGLIKTLRRGLLAVSRQSAAVGLGWLTRHVESRAAIAALEASAAGDRSEDVRRAAIQSLGTARGTFALDALHRLEEAPGHLSEEISLALAKRADRLFVPTTEAPKPGTLIPTAGLKKAVVFGMILAGVEFAGGVATDTIGLRADALNLLGDRLVDATALFSLWLLGRPATSRMTYGYRKAEPAMTLVLAAALATLGVFLGVETVHSFLHPVAAAGWMVPGFAALSLMSSLLSIASTRAHRKSHQMINAAFLNASASAAATSVFIAASVASLIWELHYLMPFATVLLVLMILRVAWEIGHGAWHVLLDGVPQGLDEVQLREDLRALPGVAGIVYAHPRAISSTEATLEARLLIEESADGAAVEEAAEALLREKYGKFNWVRATINATRKLPRQ